MSQLSELHDDSKQNENQSGISSGMVLLATEQLQDHNFDRGVVLICLHSNEGTYGLVLNRPSHMPLSEIFDGFQGKDVKREIFIGGPVQQEELQILQISESPVESAYRIVPGVYMGGKWDSISQMIDTDPATTRLFLGYSGWGPEQLESEIAAGAWEIFKIDIKKLLTNPAISIVADIKKLTAYLSSLQI